MRELTGPDGNAVIDTAARRLNHLRGNMPGRRWIILVVTWLCATSGMITAGVAPGTMPEINNQETTLGLGVAVTVALISSRERD